MQDSELPDGWRVLRDAEAVARACCEHILDAAQTAIAARGEFRLVLSGGRTPLRTYERLAGANADWDRWSLYYGDERCVPVHDRQRNSRGVEQAWLDPAGFPADRHFPMPAQLGAEAGAAAYGAVVAAARPFDLVLLGIGEDGHVASLFPGHAEQSGAVVAVKAAPKPPPERVSLNYPTLCATREVLILVTGAGKRDAARRWLRGEDLPVARIRPEGRLRVLLDGAAAGD